MSNSKKEDYYKTLGVEKNASKDEITKAYRKLARKFHPDVQHGKTEAEKKEAEEKFKEINEAYAVLSDKDKRAQYDQFGFDGPGGFSPGEGFDPFSFFRQHFSGGSAFDGMFGGNPFGYGFSSSSSEPPNFNAPEDGDDIEIPIEVKFNDVVHGSTKEFDFDGDIECSICHGTGIKPGTTPKTCSKCNGSGQFAKISRTPFGMTQVISQCPECHGAGVEVERCETCHGNKRTSKKRHVKVNVPQGIESNQRLVLRGAGECGVKGGKSGDLYLKIVVNQPAFLSRNGNDLTTLIPLDPFVASFGGEVEIVTPWNVEKLQIPVGTTSGKTFKLSGKGLKSQRGSGDFYAKVVLEPFKDLSEECKKKIEELRSLISPSNIVGFDETKKKLENSFKKS